MYIILFVPMMTFAANGWYENHIANWNRIGLLRQRAQAHPYTPARWRVTVADRNPFVMLMAHPVRGFLYASTGWIQHESISIFTNNRELAVSNSKRPPIFRKAVTGPSELYSLVKPRLQVQIWLTREVRVRHQFGDHVPAEYVQVLGEVALVGYTPVPDNVIAALRTTALHQGREQAGVVEQSDFVAAEIVTRVLPYAPLGYFREVVPVLVTLERRHVPVHAEFVQHVVVIRTCLGHRRVVLVVVVRVPGVKQSFVRAVAKQLASNPIWTGIIYDHYFRFLPL